MVAKHEGKRPPDEPRREWENITTMDLSEIAGCELD
jgi:hypothetical protein